MNINQNIVYDGKWFYIEERLKKDRKTPILNIYAKDSLKLGEIKWYGAWRKFCFYPDNNTIWDNKCLNDLNKFLLGYNYNWKNKVGE